ncbi:MAG: hypothetical protein A7316_09850 [Candidatus Altiarchaeales archaeon WOR_SM1_86-2]|nr:MAG: hypothetical protein A7316_09850 [Candidatus Altiarchaeales archaeon WOR_SM1_86-2]
MHIPDGFLSFPIWAGMWITALIILGYAIMKVNKKLGDKHIPLMGVLAAFIFAGQMLNIPVAAGTSGHMLGGVLAASFLGAMAASVIMATVFIVQAVFFQDGGITALGANIFNMGLIGTIFGYYVYRGVRRVIGEDSKKGILIGAGVAAWLAVVLASAACSIELAASGVFPLKESLIGMVAIHSIIGVIEAGITIAVVSFVLKVRPDLFNLEKI